MTAGGIEMPHSQSPPPTATGSSQGGGKPSAWQSLPIPPRRAQLPGIPAARGCLRRAWNPGPQVCRLREKPASRPGKGVSGVGCVSCASLPPYKYAGNRNVQEKWETTRFSRRGEGIGGDGSHGWCGDVVEPPRRSLVWCRTDGCISPSALWPMAEGQNKAGICPPLPRLHSKS